ncbi:MAG: type IV pilus secretin PilQ [Bdellovibrionales bacterium]|nr:type IV pilus secretin PilQ [Bdellovibrionales bacterium]
MNATASLQRVITALALGFLVVFTIGCAANSTSSVVSSPSVDVATNDTNEIPTLDTAQAASIEEFLSDRSSSTSMLVSTADNSFTIEAFSNGDNSSRLAVRFGTGTPEYEMIRLSNPERLVVDLANADVKMNRVFEVSDSSFIRSVRLGAHEDKERLVIDLFGDVPVQHQAQIIDNALIVTLSQDIQTANVDFDEYQRGAYLASTAVASEEAELALEGDIALNDELRAAPPTMESLDAAPESPSAEMLEVDTTPLAPTVKESVAARLEGLNIENSGPGGNMVVARISAPALYTIQKTAQTEYTVKLEGTVLDPQVAQSVLAPPQSGLIRSVRPVQEGNNVLLRIFSKPNVNLAAKTRGDELVISVDEEMTEGPMAQLADGKVEVSDSPSENELSRLFEPEQKYTGRLISLDLQDTDIDNALRIIAEVSNLNIIASDDVTGKVTLRLIDVPWDQALDVILKTNGLDMVQEMNVIRVAPIEKLRTEREALREARRAEKELEPLLVRYIRISYAKATEVKPLIEAVLTERGSVAVDERTNQVIVKDIQEGISNVAELVSKLDLRTPQVLLETQIVEAQRNFLRDLGSEVGFAYVQSPATGNATGDNFPNSVIVNGSAKDDGIGLASFPAAVGESAGSAVSALFTSADGTKTLDVRLSALEQEGRVRVVSRPSVATVNNKMAIIKSVEKIRVKTPSSGSSVATGQGASASGGSTTAFETFEVGITLEVVPQASPDYYVLLDINAKSSTLGAEVVDGIPSEVERSATSTVLVESGQTFALGGIYKITDNDSVDGVPFFKDIPVFGHFFRRQLVDNSDEELIFFITPRIVEGSFDDAAMRSVHG